MTRAPTAQRAFAALTAAGVPAHEAQRVLDVLGSAGLDVVAGQENELVVRRVDVLERAVPPDADTIIRTITTTSGDSAFSTTHWLDGLRAPNRAP